MRAVDEWARPCCARCAAHITRCCPDPPFPGVCAMTAAQAYDVAVDAPAGVLLEVLAELGHRVAVTGQWNCMPRGHKWAHRERDRYWTEAVTLERAERAERAAGLRPPLTSRPSRPTRLPARPVHTPARIARQDALDAAREEAELAERRAYHQLARRIRLDRENTTRHRPTD